MDFALLPPMNAHHVERVVALYHPILMFLSLLVDVYYLYFLVHPWMSCLWIATFCALVLHSFYYFNSCNRLLVLPNTVQPSQEVLSTIHLARACHHTQRCSCAHTRVWVTFLFLKVATLVSRLGSGPRMTVFRKINLLSKRIANFLRNKNYKSLCAPYLASRSQFFPARDWLGFLPNTQTRRRVVPLITAIMFGTVSRSTVRLTSVGCQYVIWRFGLLIIG